ncbi:hypothetical protein BKE38_06275 [Pseudoroseomonas deserti]|uniref:Uncharacterized protein n=1 Tax=Teichococcus deserti TaxID=1817963 RepID=A0A1V2H7B1_9PROT|nr:hypothetical protein [Pseudoroseomonas deserti]ONG56254.1 hypothetical protein BKE38_06275 [Pseudoroseomonas deserti]
MTETRARDAQRQRVYAWEDRVIAPHGGGMIAFAAAQPMVDAIWAELGLRFPPKVEPLPHQARRRIADADRLRLRLPAACPPWVLLHELAHSLTSTAEGASDGHGADFVGLYLQLLIRYLRLDRARLLASLDAAGIAVNLDARPRFLDRPA